jgi:ataxia telangiectasia mutated family protein
LKYNRGRPEVFDDIGSKAILSLCDTLFNLMRDLRSTYQRAKSKTTAKTLLPLTAEALRHTLDASVFIIKGPTVELVIESIIEVLPDNHGTLLPPLLEDLPKALRVLLGHQPHVERLSQESWDAAVIFSIESLSSLLVDPEPEAHDSWSTGASSTRARTPLQSVEVPSKPSSRDPSRTKPIAEEFSRAADDFVHCLHLLVKASNAPVLDKADRILAILMQLLQRKVTRVYLVALAAVNCILSRIALHSTQLTKRTIRELLPLMKSLWSDLTLRDEILIALMHTEGHLTSILADKHEDTASFDVEVLIETMYGDYRRRQETIALQYLEDDHLCFRNIGKPRDDTHPLNTYAFSLETEQLRCEGLWATVSAIARFSFMLDNKKREMAHDRGDEEDSLIKRLRITHHFQDYLRHVSEPRSNAKRAALQVIAFMVQVGPLDVEDLQATLEKLTPYIADENPVHSAWAMVALSA